MVSGTAPGYWLTTENGPQWQKSHAGSPVAAVLVEFHVSDTVQADGSYLNPGLSICVPRLRLEHPRINPDEIIRFAGDKAAGR